MSPHYTNGQGYPSSYLASGRQHAASLSATTASQRHVSDISPQHGSHTLPPIAVSHYAPALTQNPYTSRAQPLQPSLPTSGPTSLNQSVLMPVYGPTAQTYYSSDTGTVTAYSQSPAPQQSYRTSAPPYHVHQSQSTAPFPSSRQSSRLPDLRPIPIQTLSAEESTIPKSARPLAAATLSTDDSQPIHVVGSQGRRGILPSAAGRPPAVGENAANNQRGLTAPPKDSEGKYPCEHCPKTYLHAKHLKRHMLRRKSTPFAFGF